MLQKSDTERKTAKRVNSVARKPKIGRPSSFTEERAQRIIKGLTEGRSLASICAERGMPSFASVWNWVNTNESFYKEIARAREIGTHYLADECIKIADDKSEEPNSRRVMIDTRLKLIGKWNQRHYGDAVQMRHANADGTGPVQVEQTTRVAIIDRLLDAIPLEVTRVESLPRDDDT